MAFNNPASKLERAVRAFLILQGKATQADCFISNDSRARLVIPNRTVQVVAFSPKYHFRTEGICHFQIVHHFPAIVQPQAEGAAPGVENYDSQRIGMDEYLGDTMDSLSFGDGQSLLLVANGITLAGRSLAMPVDQTQAAIQLAQNNADMVNFRCDWIKWATPELTRGRESENRRRDADNWIGE